MTGERPRLFRIFISYRRSDSAQAAGRLAEIIGSVLGAESVFMDVESIRLGADFVTSIEEAIQSTDLLVALIGRDWLSKQGERGRRIDDQADVLRLELEAAIRSGVDMVPILVDDARMPRADELPSTLAPLARHQAFHLRHATFRHDASRLLEMIADSEARRDSPWKYLQGHWYGDWGNNYILAEGNLVRIIYDYRHGRIMATIQDGLLRGWWTEEPTRQPPDSAGEVEFAVPERGGIAELAGQWWYGAKNAEAMPWFISKIDNSVPAEIKVRFLRHSEFISGPWGG